MSIDGNIVVSTPYTTPWDARLELHKVYIIDLQTARQFSLGPGYQPAIVLPKNTQVRKPRGLQELDPYSWDVYCLGETFLGIGEVCSYPVESPCSRS